MKLETLAVHAGYSADPTTKAVAVPIYQTVSYAFDSAQHGADLFELKVPGNIYTRIMNPTTDVLEKRVAALEGGIAALAVASGMAAITYAIQTIAEAGDNIVSASTLYGGTYNLFAHTLPQQGITTRFADPRDRASFAQHIDARTKAIFVESVGNPLGNVTDIRALADVAHAHGIPLIVDNTVTSPRKPDFGLSGVALKRNRDEWMLRMRRMGSCPCKQPGRPIARFRPNPSGKCLAGRSAALRRLRIAWLSTAHRA